jgi:hypothetical protein
MHPSDKILRRDREFPENHASDFQSGITLRSLIWEFRQGHLKPTISDTPRVKPQGCPDKYGRDGT